MSLLKGLVRENGIKVLQKGFLFCFEKNWITETIPRKPYEILNQQV
jgi:hypothetical protein